MWPLSWACANRLLISEGIHEEKVGFELRSTWTRTPHVFLPAIPEGAYALNICTQVERVLSNRRIFPFVQFFSDYKALPRNSHEHKHLFKSALFPDFLILSKQHLINACLIHSKSIYQGIPMFQALCHPLWRQRQRKYSLPSSGSQSNGKNQ